MHQKSEKKTETTQGPSPHKLDTKPEIALMFQVTERTIDQYVADGKIPAIRISARCIRFDREAVLRALHDKFST